MSRNDIGYSYILIEYNVVISDTAHITTPTEQEVLEMHTLFLRAGWGNVLKFG